MFLLHLFLINIFRYRFHFPSFQCLPHWIMSGRRIYLAGWRSSMEKMEWNLMLKMRCWTVRSEFEGQRGLGSLHFITVAISFARQRIATISAIFTVSISTPTSIVWHLTLITSFLAITHLRFDSFPFYWLWAEFWVRMAENFLCRL